MYINNETHDIRYNIVMNPTSYEKLQAISLCFLMSICLMCLVIYFDKNLQRQLKYNTE